MSSNSFLLKDIFVGQEVDHVWQVTVKQIDQFALLSGDYNPLHVSAEYARLLKQIIVKLESHSN